jgi:hypothetical protein
MKKYFVALILAGLSVSPLAQAEEAFVGAMFGQLKVEDIEPRNLGITLGGTADNGFGFEVFYLFTVDEDTQTVLGDKVDSSTDALGLLASYKTPGNIYFKGKVGWGLAGLRVDVRGVGSADDDTSGFVYGAAIGATLERIGTLELSYLKFPDFDEFDGLALDSADVEFVSLAYMWNF